MQNSIKNEICLHLNDLGAKNICNPQFGNKFIGVKVLSYFSEFNRHLTFDVAFLDIFCQDFNFFYSSVKVKEILGYFKKPFNGGFSWHLLSDLLIFVA